MKELVLACLLQAAIIFPATDKTNVQIARYPYPWGLVTVSFDPKRVTKTELDSWMRLSPELSANNDLSGLIDIRRCLPNDKEYVDCGSHAKLRISNIDVNIRKIQALKKSLETQKAPDGLKAVVAYLSEIQTFSLWRTQQQRKFLLTRDVSVLRNRYGDIDPNRSCAGVLQNVTRSQEKDISKLVTVDWANCVWNLEAKKIGPYPKAKWQTFLTSHKITEVVTEEVPEQ